MKDAVIVDAVRETRPPFSPVAVVKEFAALLKSYGVTSIVSDRWGGEWVVEAWRNEGIVCRPCALPKSDLYVALVPMIHSRQIEIPRHARLRAQLLALDRRPARSGKDAVDAQGPEDIANSVAGVAHMLLRDVVPLEFFDLRTVAPPSVDDIQAAHDAEQARLIAESARTVADAIATDGIYWPR